jgi:MFS family permease
VSSGFSQAYYPDALRGRIGTSMAVLNYGSIPLGAVLGGVLATTFGLRPTLWIALIGCMLVTALLLRQPFRSTRDLPTTVAPWPTSSNAALQDGARQNGASQKVLAG